MKRPKYRVLTWDIDRQKFTPQPGVRSGPYTLFALRKVLRRLNHMGYDIKRAFAPSVLVERIEDKRCSSKL